MKRQVLSVMLATAMVTGLLPNTALADETGTAEVRYSMDAGKSWTESGLLDALQSSGISSADSVQIELLQDITLTAGNGGNWSNSLQTIAKKGNSTWAIDGKGHTIKRGAGVDTGLFSASVAGSVVTFRNITIDGGANWQAQDPTTRANSGITLGSDASLIYVSGGAKVVLESGTILQNNDASGSDEGAAVKDGGPNGAGTLVMNSGAEIKNNSAKTGTAVYIYNDKSVFEMNGGEIYGNYASSKNGVVYNKGDFEMNGGKIHDNAGGGVFVHSASANIPDSPLIDNGTEAVTYANVTGVTLDSNSLTFTSAGESKQLTATVVPSSAVNKNVTWVSSDTNVATVDASGKVTAVSSGTCTVTAITEDGNIMAVCKITVNIPVAVVTTAPTVAPTLTPTEIPSATPTLSPTMIPITGPALEPTTVPTETPVVEPTTAPTEAPVVEPTIAPTAAPVDEGFVSAEEQKMNTIALDSELKASQTGNRINIAWGEVESAEGYKVYVQYCGQTFNDKSLNSVGSGDVTNITVTKINGKSINKTKSYKVYVVAYKTVNGEEVILGRSIFAHFAGSKSKKYTDVKNINLDKTSYNLAAGETAQINASVELVNKNKEQLSDNHTRPFRYATDDNTVATVSKSGEISAVGTGSCTIYVYAKNGCTEKIDIVVE